MINNLKREEIYSIPEKMVGHYYPEISAIVDTWEASLFVSSEDWKSTVFDIGVSEIVPKFKVKHWIINTSKARSVFPPAIQDYAENKAKPALEKHGLTHLIVVLPETGIGRFSAGKTADIYDAGKLNAYQVENLDEALALIT